MVSHNTAIFNLHPRTGPAIDSLIDNNLITVIAKGNLDTVRLVGSRQGVDQIAVEPDFPTMLSILHAPCFSQESPETSL